MQFAHRIDRAKIQVFAKNKGLRQARQFRFRGCRCRSDHARFDPCVAFPFAPLADQIFFQRGEAHHQGAAVAVGAQAHVHAEHITVSGRLVNDADQTPTQAREKFVIAQRAIIVLFMGLACFAVFGINKNQIDVGRHIELAATQFPHADDQQLLGCLAMLAYRGAELCLQDSHQAALRVPHTNLCQRGHGLHDFIQIGQAVQVAQDELDHDLLAQYTHSFGQLRLVGQVQSREPEQREYPGAIAWSGIVVSQPIEQIWVGLQHASGITAALPGFFQQAVKIMG